MIVRVRLNLEEKRSRCLINGSPVKNLKRRNDNETIQHRASEQVSSRQIRRPDKRCNLDACLAEDKDSRVACECMVKGETGYSLRRDNNQGKGQLCCSSAASRGKTRLQGVAGVHQHHRAVRGDCRRREKRKRPASRRPRYYVRICHQRNKKPPPLRLRFSKPNHQSNRGRCGGCRGVFSEMRSAK